MEADFISHCYLSTFFVCSSPDTSAPDFVFSLSFCATSIPSIVRKVLAVANPIKCLLEKEEPKSESRGISVVSVSVYDRLCCSKPILSLYSNYHILSSHKRPIDRFSTIFH